MKKWLVMLTVLPALALAACDGPDEIYKPIPKDWDPVRVNGILKQSVTFEGAKGFLDETATVTAVGPTVELCTDTELSQKWAEMMVKPIIPMVGGGGLDMRGVDWDGLTVDEAQSKDMLCQSIYLSADGVIAWGDNFEVIGFFDTATRKIQDMLLWPGYEGTIDAPPFVFKVNRSIEKDGVPLNRGDGGARDPRTEVNMIAMNRALLQYFRPDFPGGYETADCVETGSCFVIATGTLPIIAFLDVGVYIPMEPTNLRLTQIEVSLKRPFDFKTSSLDMDGPVPTLSGFGSCNITFGTDWGHIQSACIGDDPLSMAAFQPTASSEWITGDFDGFVVYTTRALGPEEIFRLEDLPEAGDTVIGIAFGEQYEGPMNLPFSPMLTIFKQKLMDGVRELAGLDPTALTGVETLRMPGDPNLPAEVDASYPDRLQPRTVKAAFCSDDGPDPNTEYDTCQQDVTGSNVLLLMKTLESNIGTALGTAMVPTLRERTFYAQLFLEALYEYFNDGPLVANQASYSPSGAADTIRGSLMMEKDGEPYTVWASYDGLDDRMGWLQIYNGYNRPESVLARDAELGSGVFLFDDLVASPRVGLGSDNISIDHTVSDIRRAVVNFPMREGETLTTLVPYIPMSTTSGYYIPQEGAHNEFHQADYISLGGYTFGAELYAVPAADDPAKREVVAIISGDFYGPTSFCGQTVELGDWVEDIMSGIIDSGYPCTLIIRWSEGEVYILSLSSVEDQRTIYFDNDRFYAALAWLR
jgi:hypothetical protein